MFSLLTVLLVAAVSIQCASSFVFQETKSVICIPETTFYYDHNRCTCNDEGTEITCERKILSTLVPEFHDSQLQNATIECVPGRKFELNCLECVCDESGVYATCLNSDCAKGESRFDTPERCIPGSIFNADCNGCICGDDGKAACTQLNCPAMNSETGEIICVAGSSLTYQCNDCTCAEDGKGMFCNRMFCSSPFSFYADSLQNITVGCKPETTFDYNCQQCYCNANGNHAICSGKACPLEYELKAVKDTIDDCNPGAIFANDCNTCVCNNNRKGVCTKFSCDLNYQFKYINDMD